MRSYRVVVTYSADGGVFVARAPELAGCTAEGQTREEAISRLEAEISAQIENMETKGIDPPDPVDDVEVSGSLSVTVSKPLHRELLFRAKEDGVDLDQLIPELLLRGIASRIGSGRGRRDNRGRGRREREGSGARYHDIMENRADFIEYVRRLDSGGCGGGRGRDRGGRGGNR